MKRLSRRAPLRYIFAISMLCTITNSPQTNLISQATQGAIPVAQFFGIHAHNWQQFFKSPEHNIFGSYRAWDVRTRWPDLEPSQGNFNFSSLDKIVEATLNEKIELVLPLAMTPKWASTNPAASSAYSPGESAPPKRLEDWVNFVTVIATRYKGRIAAYEIWNEPNIPKFFNGNTHDAIQLTCSAHKVIKAIDPDAIVISPAPAGESGIPWLRRFLEHGGAKCADVIGFHYYNQHKDPESHIELHQKLKALLERYQIRNKPIWNTEVGWLTSVSNDNRTSESVGFPPGTRRLTNLEAISLVSRTILIHLSLGIERTFLYALDNREMGLIPNGSTSSPVLTAYKHTKNILTEGWVSKLKMNRDNYWTCDFNQGNKRTGIFIWKGNESTRRPEVDLSSVHSLRILGKGRTNQQEFLSSLAQGYVGFIEEEPSNISLRH